MPMLKARDPSKYSLRFHQLIESGLGDWRMGLEQATESAADRELRRFAQFRRDCLSHPAHKTSRKLKQYLEAGWTIRAKLVLTPTGWDVEVRIRRGKFESVRPTGGSDLEMLQALSKSLGKKMAAGD